MTATSANRPARVWFIQPRVEHYRLPVFDGLAEAGAGTYTFEVMGPMKDGEAVGGGARPYLREIPAGTSKRLGLSFTSWPTAEELVRAERPDCVVLQVNPRNTTAWSLPKVNRSLGIATIGWSKIHSFSGLPQPVMRVVKSRLYRRYDQVICYGQSALGELKGLGFPEERAVVAQNTIDTRRIFDRGEEIATRGRQLRVAAGLGDGKMIICVGRMDPEKRHGDLLDAWPTLIKADPSLSLVLVSGGPLLEEIRDRAKAIDPERILVTGRVPEGDDYAWIAAADMAVYPGAVGLAINQTLAFGKPVLIADEWGSDAEIVRHGQTGWRFPRGDIDAMARQILEVFTSDEQRTAVMETAVSMMRDEVTIENMVRNIDTAVRRALASRPDTE